METRLIVGLGNPGREYAGTRHNVGFGVVELLAERHKVDIGRYAFHGLVGDAELFRNRIVLLRPLTYMNLSGGAVSAAVKYYGLSPQSVCIVADDVALPVGRLRLRISGSPGGHNGLKSIEAALCSRDYCRVRIGVGPPTVPLIEYVLGRFERDELPLMRAALELAVDALTYAVEFGFDQAMAEYNRVPEVE